MADAAPVQTAKAMSFEICEHGSVTFYMHGEDGKAFAQGHFALPDCVAFILDITAELERFQHRREVREFPPCQGHA